MTYLIGNWSKKELGIKKFMARKDNMIDKKMTVEIYGNKNIPEIYKDKVQLMCKIYKVFSNDTADETWIDFGYPKDNAPDGNPLADRITWHGAAIDPASDTKILAGMVNVERSEGQFIQQLAFTLGDLLSLQYDPILYSGKNRDQIVVDKFRTPLGCWLATKLIIGTKDVAEFDRIIKVCICGRDSLKLAIEFGEATPADKAVGIAEIVGIATVFEDKMVLEDLVDTSDIEPKILEVIKKLEEVHHTVFERVFKERKFTDDDIEEFVSVMNALEILL